MKALDLERLREPLRSGNILWRKHALLRMAEWNISRAAVVDVLLDGQRIRDYLEDKPFASALFLGYDGSRPLHVVASVDETNRQVFIITVYEPSLDVFESDYKTKRKA
ncbi:MAG: DUF4258 domain-containing protein [Chloroflexi bacterium]|nr:DUF4258 domain-containing protein [Chloroflexota bacterium]